MSSKQQKKSLLDPYRTIGGFISGRLSLSQSSPVALTAPTGCSFKVYSENLAIKVASPSFSNPITAAISYNEYTYLRTRDLVVKMKYHHIVRRWDVRGGDKRCDLLKFEGILILNDGNRLILIDQSTNEVIQQEYPFDIEGIIHPVTYVNKILLYSGNNLVLVNAISNKVLYSFQRFIKNCQENDQKITAISASPLVDIIGVGLDNGVISFLHLKKDQVVFSVKQKLPVTSIAFSHEHSWMASGDQNGNVILWDLESKRILYKFEQCLNGLIDSLLFIPGLPVLTCGSSMANCIRQLRVNLEDNKILSLYRERLGSKQSLQAAVIANNNEVVLSTDSQTMFVSFHSQCNSYLLPRTLDSKLPYHLVARHFNVQLYKGNSFEKSFPIHQYATTAKISLSNKYYIVATKRKMIKLGGSTPIEWAIPNIRHIVLFNEHSIFAITPNQIVVCDFNTNTILSKIDVCANVPATNTSNTLLSFENTQSKQIEVWDMLKITQGRIFEIEAHGPVLCLSFTTQNRFLVSSHKGGKLNIWSVVDNQLYKSYDLNGNDMIWHSFTPDNQFMVSIFQGRKQANVWNNYIGRLTSTRNEEQLAFEPQIRHLEEDYRIELANAQPFSQLEINQSVEDVLDHIPDADDGVPNYTFKDITKWMPLVYYDQIRNRNAPNSATDIPSMPFFLDFKNLTEEKKKIEEEIQKEAREKRRNYSQQKDKHLKNQSNEISLNEESTVSDHLQAFEKLCCLSVAEVDYQLRSFLLNPANKPYLVTMMTSVLQDKSIRVSEQIKNIILTRVMNLLGGDLLSGELIEPCNELLTVLQPALKELKGKVDRCVAISTKHLL